MTQPREPDSITYADVVAARIPGARVERLSGAGHLFFWEQPDPCVRIISEFLQ